MSNGVSVHSCEALQGAGYRYIFVFVIPRLQMFHCLFLPHQTCRNIKPSPRLCRGEGFLMGSRLGNYGELHTNCSFLRSFCLNRHGY